MYGKRRTTKRSKYKTKPKTKTKSKRSWKSYTKPAHRTAVAALALGTAGRGAYKAYKAYRNWDENLENNLIRGMYKGTVNAKRRQTRKKKGYW